MGKTKDLKRKAHHLRLKEVRLKKQTSLLSRGNDLLEAARREGREEGYVKGLETALNISEQMKAKDHKRSVREAISEEVRLVRGG